MVGRLSGAVDKLPGLALFAGVCCRCSAVYLCLQLCQPVISRRQPGALFSAVSLRSSQAALQVGIGGDSLVVGCLLLL